MRIRGKILMTLMAVCMMASFAFAQDKTEKPADMEMDMSQFGPPKEMKELESMVGDWKYTGQMRMGPEADWTDNEADVSFTMVAGGSALMMDFRGMMMGMEMHGIGMTSFDRYSGMWQEMWVDNFMGKFSIYEGTFKDGKKVIAGVDEMGDQKMFTRMTTYDIAETEFKWMMENSMDGENYYISMRGVYKKTQ